MDYGRVLRRSLDITWRYRALWVFGIVLAVFAGFSAGNGGASRANIVFSGNGRVFGDLAGLRTLGGAGWATIAAAGGMAALGGLLLFLVLVVVGTVAYYVSITAVVRMVDATEDTGEKLPWTEGVRLGWSRGSARLFLIDLLVGLATFTFFFLLFILALLPLLLWTTGETGAGIAGTVATAGFVVLLIGLSVAVALAFSLLRPFVYRMAVLRDLGVFAAVKQGCIAAWEHFPQVGTMWLIMAAINIAVAVAMFVLGLALVMLALAAAGIPAWIVYFVTSSLLGEAAGAIMAAAVGLPVASVIVVLPSLFAGGLWQVYLSTAWTLTFRQLLGSAPEASAPALVPEAPVDSA